MVVFWSPDSRFVGFGASGKLQRVDRSGGARSDLRGEVRDGSHMGPRGHDSVRSELRRWERHLPRVGKRWSRHASHRCRSRAQRTGALLAELPSGRRATSSTLRAFNRIRARSPTRSIWRRSMHPAASEWPTRSRAWRMCRRARALRARRGPDGPDVRPERFQFSGDPAGSPKGWLITRRTGNAGFTVSDNGRSPIITPGTLSPRLAGSRENRIRMGGARLRRDSDLTDGATDRGRSDRSENRGQRHFDLRRSPGFRSDSLRIQMGASPCGRGMDTVSSSDRDAVAARPLHQVVVDGVEEQVCRGPHQLKCHNRAGRVVRRSINRIHRIRLKRGGPVDLPLDAIERRSHIS